MKFFSTLFFVLLFVNFSHSQSLLQVFLTCNGNCDSDFLKTEMTGEINFVNDVQTSDIQLFMTDVETGSGGASIMMVLDGKQKFDALQDTIRYTLDPNLTFDEKRRTMLKYFRLGLVRYLVHNGQGEDITLSFDKVPVTDMSNKSCKAPPVKDPYDFWIFNVGVDGNVSGEKSITSYWFGGKISANRVTDNQKLFINANISENRTSFVLDADEPPYVTINSSRYVGLDDIFTINNHWSWGLFSHYQSSTFSNFKHQFNFGLGMEYSLFDYKKSNEKYITFQYKINNTFNIYNDTTLYDKIKENLLSHSLSTALNFTQPWGNLYTSLSWKNYLHDWYKNAASFDAGAEIRVFKGFSVNFNLGIQFIRNQLNLPKVGASEEEILTRQRVLATSYSYYSWFGVNYRFGSIFNNVVNPRFNSSQQIF